MDPGIGPAGPDGLDGLAQDPARGLQQETLPSRQAGLVLPAVQVRAVIGEDETEGTRRQRISSSAIWIPFRAAPLRSWSPTTQKLSALGCERSSRIRPT